MRFVTKNRLKKLQLYSILGSTKEKNIQLLSFIGTSFSSGQRGARGSASCSVASRLPFYWNSIPFNRHSIPIQRSVGWRFRDCLLLNATSNAGRPLMLSEKKKGETEGANFYPLRALIGAGLLGSAYYMSPNDWSTCCCIYSSFVARLLVV